MSELTKCLINMKNNKSPETDGFLSKYFKIFWKKMDAFVIRSVNHSYNIGELF